jgi:hypothetical protein
MRAAGRSLRGLALGLHIQGLVPQLDELLLGRHLAAGGHLQAEGQRARRVERVSERLLTSAGVIPGRTSLVTFRSSCAEVMVTPASRAPLISPRIACDGRCRVLFDGALGPGQDLLARILDLLLR